jgi:hypothetical protein
MLKDPDLSEIHDWLSHKLNERLKSDADGVAWNEQDVRQFAAEYEVEPKTDAELYRIVCKRLADIKHSVETSENSRRDELSSDAPEKKLRRWIALKLQDRSRDKYVVPEEAVVDLDQRPDIRVANPVAGVVSIEVKWAHSWTLPVLLERLENQLVGQYLRAKDARFGIYAIGMIQNHRWENPETSKLIQFEEVVEILQRRARVLEEGQDVLGVTVIGIDFRDPRQK